MLTLLFQTLYDVFRPKTVLEIEIKRNERALARYEAKIEELTGYFWDNKMPCCPTCAFPELSTLGEKVERVEKQLKRLRRKQARSGRRR